MTAAALSPALEEFKTIVGGIVTTIGVRRLDAALETCLNRDYAPQGAVFRKLSGLLAQGMNDGWLCQREAAGIRFGRVIKPGAEAGLFSVDVVRMDDVVGPHHVHPQGEIGMIVPLAGAPRFDGREEGWYVYEPGSAHRPTVTNGAACILYLLPDGAITFTGQ